MNSVKVTSCKDQNNNIVLTYKLDNDSLCLHYQKIGKFTYLLLSNPSDIKKNISYNHDSFTEILKLVKHLKTNLSHPKVNEELIDYFHCFESRLSLASNAEGNVLTAHLLIWEQVMTDILELEYLSPFELQKLANKYTINLQPSTITQTFNEIMNTPRA